MWHFAWGAFMGGIMKGKKKRGGSVWERESCMWGQKLNLVGGTNAPITHARPPPPPGAVTVYKQYNL